jgi:4-amino-4-deoxy-L-arabinose transferase-like glycosyltransferase
MSGLTVAAWQADALLIASGAGALMAAGIASGPVGAVVLGAVLCGLLVWATRRRVDRR